MLPIEALFQALNPAQKREYGKITGERGSGAYSAETHTGVPIILYGTAKTGQAVWYDAYTNQIISQAPIVTFFDIEI